MPGLFLLLCSYFGTDLTYYGSARGNYKSHIAVIVFREDITIFVLECANNLEDDP
jgi:hypothetical protein